MLEYGALEKALEVVNPKQPNRNGKVKTNRNLRKSNSLTSRPGETDWKVGICGGGAGNQLMASILSEMESGRPEGSQP